MPLPPAPVVMGQPVPVVLGQPVAMGAPVQAFPPPWQQPMQAPQPAQQTGAMAAMAVQHAIEMPDELQPADQVCGAAENASLAAQQHHLFCRRASTIS